MAVKAADLEAELIDKVCAEARERLSNKKADRLASFIRQYYHWVPPEDLADRDPSDLYGAAMAQWELGRERGQGEAKVRVYNPDPDEDGWQSAHTVVEVTCDDMPFIVDSVTMELARQGYAIDLVIHPVIWVKRDKRGRVLDVLESGSSENGAVAESVVHLEVAREPEEERRERLAENVERVLAEVRAAVEDWKPMRERTKALIDSFEQHPPSVDQGEIDEVKQFLAWMADDHFTFLGYREYDLATDEKVALKVVKDSGLGILRGTPERKKKQLTAGAAEIATSPHPLVLTKANSRATVHRPAYLDYVGVKRFDDGGKVIGECRFVGLYTSAAYRASARDIPLLRGKFEAVLERSGFPPDSHDAKALVEILESYPRDSLFQITTDELFEIAMGILTLGERQRVRLFVRRDPLERFLECLVCIPRDRFNTENRERVGRILLEELGGAHLDWTLQLSESVLARVHYIVRCSDGISDDYDVAKIESRLVKATRAWKDDLREALVEEHGEAQGLRLFERYAEAFPAAYRSDWSGGAAVADVENVEELASRGEPILTLYRPREEGASPAREEDRGEEDGEEDRGEGDRETEGRENGRGPDRKHQLNLIRCKLFSAAGVSLSDVLPTFEHMGAKVVDERPYEISPQDGDPAWIYDFGLQAPAEDVERVGDIFQDAFLGVWRGELEDDGLGGLVLAGALTGREITVIRAIAKYLRQGGIAFSDAYIERTLLGHAEIATMLLKLFVARFDPERHDEKDADKIRGEIEEAIDAVESLDEDRILRSFLNVIGAILRTNFFRVADGGEPVPYLSFKLDPDAIPFLPRPRPKFEIFVYSPRVEGVHLRGGNVARGGLRWSDRREDFRTEILGLMKAQMVKNALIVPVGSKGGFVVKRPPAEGGRDALQKEAIECYKTFLSGLLDVTDNIVEGKVVGPEQVVRYDDDDPYLVVAADKGTASFSDIANGVSESYGFWLGDAFASGGSKGYDHKEMGITARGAWESVKRHFRELGCDIQSTEFTVVGVGDMSGDVFGNGMLLSPHIKLLAAFNHAHVFLDPDPDPERSFKERKRLFEMERSSWEDYDEKAISKGGGIYSRSEKSISITKQVKEALAIDEDKLSPQELIRAILKAPVDLLWNGGIGTYVKASSETHADAGDKSNDAVRIDARELRCRVVGEGGNLGFTQAGRVEYARIGGPEGEGGRINTDAIDNVAGVNCSDHEVNIKILLDSLVTDGELTEDQRNDLLVEMTDAVADQVLYASYTQTQAMSLALAQAAEMVDVHARLIGRLEQVASLDRELEFLPSEDEIAERKSNHQGLVAPELAVVMAYCKIHLYARLLESDLPEDDYLGHDLERYFPEPLPERYSDQMSEHRLRREIIATVVANQLVDRAGTTFAFRLGEETGASPSLLARGYAAAREVFGMRPFWESVESLDNEVDAGTQLRMLIEGRRLVERATRWLVRANPDGIEITDAIEKYEKSARMLADALPDLLEGEDRESYDRRAAELIDAGVQDELADRVAGMAVLLPTFDIVEVADAIERDPETVMRAYFELGERLDLNWLRDRIIELPRANRWQALARSALRDDLNSLHRSLTQEALDAGEDGSDLAIGAWEERNRSALERCLGILADIKASRSYDMTTLPVALREVRNLIRGGVAEAAEAARQK